MLDLAVHKTMCIADYVELSLATAVMFSCALLQIPVIGFVHGDCLH